MRFTIIAIALLSAGPAAAKSESATVVHAPPTVAPANEPLELVAAIVGAWNESDLVVRYRAPGAGPYRVAIFERAASGAYLAVIPKGAVQTPSVEYYISGVRNDGKKTAHFASAKAPHVVRVEPGDVERWRVAEKARLGGRLNRATLYLQGMDFGNRFGHEDHMARGEVAWSYRMLTHVHTVQLGYGFMDGQTPTGNNDDSESRHRAAHYGFGGVTLRLHEYIFMDVRAALGFSRDGFIVGGGGQITLGRPWESSVSAGLEEYEDMRGEYWLRLQWDSVPPFLMGAAIHKTDLPGAFIGGGSYVAYDASYPVTQQMWLGAKLFYGSRDGPGRGGAQLNVVVDF